MSESVRTLPSVHRTPAHCPSQPTHGVAVKLRTLATQLDGLEQRVKQSEMQGQNTTILLAGFEKPLPEPYELDGSLGSNGLLALVSSLEERVARLEAALSPHELELTIDRIVENRLANVNLGQQTPRTPRILDSGPEDYTSTAASTGGKRKRAKPTLSNQLKEVARRCLKELLARPPPTHEPAQDLPYYQGPLEPIVDGTGRTRHRPDLMLTYKQLVGTPEGNTYIEDVRAHADSLRQAGNEVVRENEWASLGDAIETSYDGIHRAFKLAKEGSEAQGLLRTKKRRDGRRANRATARKEALARLRAEGQYLDAKYELAVDKNVVSDDETDVDEHGQPQVPKSVSSRPPVWRSPEATAFIGDLDASIRDFEAGKIRKAGANQPVVRHVGPGQDLLVPRGAPLWIVDRAHLGARAPTKSDKEYLRLRDDGGRTIEKWEDADEAELQVDPGLANAVGLAVGISTSGMELDP
jgi:hypothetical protein